MIILPAYGNLLKYYFGKRGVVMYELIHRGAVGHNPISIIIPCHRVVGSSGSLTGYAGGIDKKVRLLTLEHVDMKHLFIPENGTAL